MEHQLSTIEETQLKFKRPYAKIIDQALKRETSIYLLRQNMKLIKFNSDKDFTEFILSSGANEKRRKYSNIQLKERTEKLMSVYLDKFEK